MPAQMFASSKHVWLSQPQLLNSRNADAVPEPMTLPQPSNEQELREQLRGQGTPTPSPHSPNDTPVSLTLLRPGDRRPKSVAGEKARHYPS